MNTIHTSSTTRSAGLSANNSTTAARSKSLFAVIGIAFLAILRRDLVGVCPWLEQKVGIGT